MNNWIATGILLDMDSKIYYVVEFSKKNYLLLILVSVMSIASIIKLNKQIFKLLNKYTNLFFYNLIASEGVFNDVKKFYFDLNKDR